VNHRNPSCSAVLLCAASLVLVACLGDDESEAPILPGDPSFLRDPALDVETSSAHDELRSHNAGLNCMNCHQAHGPGKGRFTIGVTVFGPDGSIAPNPVLELYKAPPSTGAPPAYVLPGDGRGNIYTTAAMPLPDTALFVVVRSRDGALRNVMPFPTGSGACNVCHRTGFEVKLLPISTTL
jgi:hypothetical protein